MPSSRAGKKESTGLVYLRKPFWKLKVLIVTFALSLKSNHMSFREPKGRMELQDHLGPLDHLGPGVLLETLGKMAPEELKAQR